MQGMEPKQYTMVSLSGGKIDHGLRNLKYLEFVEQQQEGVKRERLLEIKRTCGSFRSLDVHFGCAKLCLPKVGFHEARQKQLLGSCIEQLPELPQGQTGKTWLSAHGI